MAANKRSKVDTENRVFKEEWTEEFSFVLKKKTDLPECLQCHFQCSVMKRDNIQGHFRKTRHTFNIVYLTGSERRRNENEKIKIASGGSLKIMTTFTSV